MTTKYYQKHKPDCQDCKHTFCCKPEVKPKEPLKGLDLLNDLEPGMMVFISNTLCSVVGNEVGELYIHPVKNTHNCLYTNKGKWTLNTVTNQAVFTTRGTLDDLLAEDIQIVPIPTQVAPTPKADIISLRPTTSSG